LEELTHRLAFTKNFLLDVQERFFLNPLSKAFGLDTALLEYPVEQVS
jgi:hypothetical protein